MGYLGDSFGWGFGFGAGVAATESAFNAVENTYRAKSFDPVVRQDLMDILGKGRLVQREYPFPKTEQKIKTPPFFVRHKVFSMSFIVLFVVMWILGKIGNAELLYKVVLAFWVFWILCILVMLAKKVLRVGKKVADFTFQTTFVNEGKKYWNIREYVRVALQNGDLTAEEAFVRIRNTELGRRLPDSNTEIEARVYRNRQSNQ